MSFFAAIVKFIGNLARRPNNTIKNSGRDVNVTNNTYNDTRITKWIIIGGVFIIVVLIFICLSGMLFVFLSGNKNSMINIGNNNNIQTTNNFYGTAIVAEQESKNVPSMQQIDNIINKAQIDISRVPDGYFIVLQRIYPAANMLVKRQFDNMPRVRPDVSIGNSFDAYIKKKNPDMHAKRLDCTHLYKESQENRIPIKCYPIELMADFDNFLVQEYIPRKQNRYINNVLNNIKLP